MRSTVFSLIRGLALAVALTAAGGAWAGSSLKDWRDGPVASLLTPEEYKEYGKLASDDARRSFIEGFWRAIDAGSGASPGSYREMFHERCAAIDDRFRNSGLPGWRTDRGRVFLALGEPASVRHEAGSVNALEREVWSYGGSTGGALEAEPRLSIVFYRCRDGSYRLDGACAVERSPTSVAYDFERWAYFRKLRDENPALGVGSGGRAALGGFLRSVPGGVALQSQPSPRPAARRDPPSSSPAPTVGGGPGVHALENAAYFFRAQDGSVLTLLTVELLADREGAGGSGESAGPDAYLGAASVEETGRRGEDLPYSSAREVALNRVPRGGDEGDAPAFFGRVYLQPGRTYAVRFAVKDGARDQVFVRNDLVGVPELSHGFSASSIVPAAEYGPAVAGDDRFQIGSEEVVPKVGGLFRRSELLRLYLQVYDAALHPETSAPRVDVVFRFFRLIKGATKRVGKPFSVRGATGASMGLALPIGDWPTGPYRVVVQLHDRVSDARATAEGSFSIVDE